MPGTRGLGECIATRRPALRKGNARQQCKALLEAALVLVEFALPLARNARIALADIEAYPILCIRVGDQPGDQFVG